MKVVVLFVSRLNLIGSPERDSQDVFASKDNVWANDHVVTKEEKKGSLRCCRLGVVPLHSMHVIIIS